MVTEDKKRGPVLFNLQQRQERLLRQRASLRLRSQQITERARALTEEIKSLDEQIAQASR